VLARAGAKVALGDLEADGVERTAAAIRQEDGEAVAIAGDLTEEGPAARLIETAVARWGRLDILVNQRGREPERQDLEMPAADWDFVLRLNLRSTFLCTRAAAPHMMRQRYGRIVCMSSGAREGTPWTAYYQGGAAYSASKAGIHGFVRDVALELAEHGVNVNAVAPGPDRHRARRPEPPSPRRDGGVQPVADDAAPPHRRAHRVAHAVLFLASDESSYITGHTLAVAGGR
jgi:3-oxoacyl-[acyl-carrier protein] reductase